MKTFQQAVVEMELAAAAFYRALAARVTDDAVKTALDYLSLEEVDHATEMKDLALDEDLGPVLEKAFADGGTLLWSIAESGMRLKAMASELQSDEDVLRLGLEAEKESMLFYHEMAAKLPPSPARTRLLQLVEIERAHFEEIHRLLKLLQKADRFSPSAPEEVVDALREAVREDEERLGGCNGMGKVEG